jgi:hypothetical protein
VLWPLKLIGALLMVAVPVLGVWLATSIAAFRNGHIGLVALAGVGLFPLLPLLWDGLGTLRRRRRQRRSGAPVRPRILTFLDRLILRTVVLNLAFDAVLLLVYPREAFVALATRGDWMLADRHDPLSEQARQVLFSAARGLEWLHERTHRNPFREMLENDRPTRRTPPAPSLPAPPPPAPPTPPRVPTAPAPSAPAPPRTAAADRSARWPLPATPHPLVASMPATAEATLDGVAGHLAAEPDPFLRVKALHDYVALRVRYDVESYRSGKYPPQDAETVLRSRAAVCAGYANLFAALAERTGDEVVRVSGVSRNSDGDVSGLGHAWNAARIGGTWYLVDATWDAGYVDGPRFEARYRTDYLFTPPEVFGSTHLPDDARWQLRQRPLDRGEFMRQPLLKPAFHAAGLVLVRPRRSQIEVADDHVDLVLGNPQHRSILVNLEVRGGEKKGRCTVVTQDLAVGVRCPLPGPGSYRVAIYASEGQPTHEFVGSLEVNHP